MQDLLFDNLVGTHVGFAVWQFNLLFGNLVGSHAGFAVWQFNLMFDNLIGAHAGFVVGNKFHPYRHSKLFVPLFFLTVHT